MLGITTPSYVNKASTYSYTTGAGTVPTSKTTCFTIEDTTTNKGEKLQEFTHLVIDFDFTKGSLDTCDLIFDYGDTNADLYQEQSEATTAGVSTLSNRVHRIAATQKGTFSVPVTHPVTRVSVLGATTATSSALTLKARLIYKP